MIALGEIIYGGVGSGLYGILLYVIVAVFIAGLMVGRTPGIPRQKTRGQGGQDGLACHAGPAAVDARLDRRCGVIPSAVASTNNAGPHGFSEILYAYISQTGNNGSAFAGLTGNTLSYNVTGGLAMLIGRYLVIIPVMVDCWLGGHEKDGAAFIWNLPNRRRPVRRPAGGRDPDHRRPDLLPRLFARARSSRISRCARTPSF